MKNNLCILEVQEVFLFGIIINMEVCMKKYKESNIVGYRIGNVMIYTYNIAFIVNLGKGTASQIMDIVTYVEKIMKEKYNIEIKREVIVIGSF